MINVLQAKLVSIVLLTLHPKNNDWIPPLTERERDALRKSICAGYEQAKGFSVITDNGKLLVLDGNHRLEALLEYGYDGQVSVSVLGDIADWPESRQRRYMEEQALAHRADNLTNEWKLKTVRSWAAGGMKQPKIENKTGMSHGAVSAMTSDVIAVRKDAEKAASAVCIGAGMSQRETAKVVGVNSPQTVSNFVKNDEIGHREGGEIAISQCTVCGFFLHGNDYRLWHCKICNRHREMSETTCGNCDKGKNPGKSSLVNTVKEEEPSVYADMLRAKTPEERKAEATAQAKAMLDENYILRRAAEIKEAKRKEKCDILQSTCSLIEQTKNVKAKTRVKNGEWWILGNHLLYCGDTSKDEFRSRLVNAAFSFADPPYGANVADWDKNFYWQHDFLSNVSSVVAVTPGIVSIFDFAKITQMPYKWSIAAWISNGMTRGGIGFGNWIYVSIFSNESVNRQAQDFVKISIKTGETDKTKHKGRKPSELLYFLVNTFSKENDIVIDPFLGSGTTLLICEQTKRRCIGGEIFPEYCSEVIGRWEEITKRRAIRANSI